MKTKMSKVAVPAGECRAVLDAMAKGDLLTLAKIKGVSVRGSKAAVIDRMAAAKALIYLEIPVGMDGKRKGAK